MIFQNSPDITSREAVNFEISLAVFIPNTLEAISYKNKDCSMIFWDISFPSLENWNYSVYFPFIWKTTGDNSGSKNVCQGQRKSWCCCYLDKKNLLFLVNFGTVRHVICTKLNRLLNIFLKSFFSLPATPL